MARLILTTDDYGLCEAVNQGVRDCVEVGAITSVQVLANLVTEEDMHKLMMSIDQAAVRFGKRCGIGLHFNTTQGPSLANNPDSSLVETVVEGRSQFYTIKTIPCDLVKEEDVQEEFELQINALSNYIGGRDRIDSISSHHNIHFFSARFSGLMLRAVTDAIPFRSPVQWRSEGDVPQPEKFKKWYEVLPIVPDSIKTYLEAQPGTQEVLGNAKSYEFLSNQRKIIRAHNNPTPVNCSEQWYGQPSYDCLVWKIKELQRLQNAYGSEPYVSELYSHVAASEGNVQLDLTYSMIRRVAEYEVWRSYKVKKLLEECYKGFQPVELCSYRDALKQA